MLCACSIFIFSAFCLCLPDNMDILPRRRALSRARSLLPERWRYPVEAAAQGGAEDARARIGHARPLAGVDDAGAAFRPVPGVGGGQRAGSDRRQALHPWQPDPAYLTLEERPVPHISFVARRTERGECAGHLQTTGMCRYSLFLLE